MATYADGVTKPTVGDLVRCESSDLIRVTCGQLCSVSAIREPYIILKEGDRYTYSPSHFSLMYPQSGTPPPPPEPLVKWPEENRLTFADLADTQLFVWRDCPDMPCIRDGDRWSAISNHYKANGMLLGMDDEVRRIQFNPANKDSVFIVI